MARRWRQTQEEQQVDIEMSRRLRYLFGGLLVAAGVGALLGLALDWMPLSSWIVLIPPPLLLCGGGLLVLDARRIDATPDPRLPTFDDLPASDPRRARPLAARRRDWILGVTLAVFGPIGGAAALWWLRMSLPGLVRLPLFLLASYGTIALVVQWMRARVGAPHWPRR